MAYYPRGISLALAFARSASSTESTAQILLQLLQSPGPSISTTTTTTSITSATSNKEPQGIIVPIGVSLSTHITLSSSLVPENSIIPQTPATSTHTTTSTATSIATESSTANLVQSLYAEAKSIEALIAALSASTTVAASQSSTGTESFTGNLAVYEQGSKVLTLQQFLNSDGFPVATSGPGSLGEETSFFGLGTYNVLVKYQAANGSSCDGGGAFVPKSPDPTDKQVGNPVRMGRLMLELSQTALADALAITFQQVQKIRKGVNRISASRLQQIANFFLQVPISFFFEELSGSTKVGKQAAESPIPVHVDEFIASSDGASLIKSYTQIKSRNLRRAIVELVEKLAN